LTRVNAKYILRYKLSSEFERVLEIVRVYSHNYVLPNTILRIAESRTGNIMTTHKTIVRSPVDVRIILSALWAARMLSGLQGDSTRFHDPVALKGLVEGTSAVPVTNALLLVMSVIFAIPIIMSILSLTLKDKANRRANRSIGIFFAAFDLVFLGLAVFLWPFSAYETFWSIAYLVFTALIVWYAWKWPRLEA